MNPDPPISCELTLLGCGTTREQLLTRLRDQLSARDWPETDRFAIELAVEEAIANAYHHGNDRGTRGHVEIRWEISRTEFMMEVRDNGDGFDLEEVPDPTEDENLEKPSGRGLLLIRSYMTTVEHREDGRLLRMQRKKGSDPPE